MVIVYAIFFMMLGAIISNWARDVYLRNQRDLLRFEVETLRKEKARLMEKEEIHLMAKLWAYSVLADIQSNHRLN